MKRTLLEILGILALTGAAGTAYNFTTRSDPQRHLAWVDERYRGMDLLPPVKAPGPRSPDAPPNPSPRDPPSAKPVKPPEDVDARKAPPEKVAVIAPPEGGLVTEAPAPPPAEKTGTAGPEELPMIDHAAAFAEYNAHTVFIDARRSREYEAGHITGARSLSAWEGDLAEKIVGLRDTEPAEAPIIVYCGSAKDCEDSKMVARQLKEVGFQNLMIYQGGFPEWQKERPALVTKGPEPGKREDA